MTTRFYSSVATEKQLVGTITSGQTTCVVSDTVGLPTSFPYTLALSYETLTEELVDVTNAAGSTLTITRAIDGTSAVSHAAGARVRHTSSARDFADSRNHENSSFGIHGLLPGEEIVGTNKVQTLTNKTVVDLTGNLKNIEITNASPHTLTVTNTPAYSAAASALEVVNGTEQVIDIKGSGLINIRNRAVDDAAFSTRRLQVTASNGTTERFTVVTSGMATSSPKTGGATADGGFKFIDPGDLTDRKAFTARNNADTLDRFVVHAGGHVDLSSSDPTKNPLNVTGAVAQSVPYFRVMNDTSTVQVQVDTAGRLESRRRAIFINDVAPASPVVVVQGNATQTADLEQWQNSAGTTIAHVRADGSSDFTSTQTTGTAVFTAAALWGTIVAEADVKAGICTVVLTVQRLGPALIASATGDLAGNPSFGTIAAAFRPNATLFSNNGMPYTATDDVGCGSMVLTPNNGDMALWAWSSGGTIANGSLVRCTMTYPLVYS